MKYDKRIEKIKDKIKKTTEYHKWRTRNKSNCCYLCSSSENLNLHHINSLEFHIRNLLFILDEEDCLQHLLELHKEDRIDCFTLCEKCHQQKTYYKKTNKNSKKIRKENWIVMPRILPGKILHHSKSCNENGLDLKDLKMLAVIGWSIINDYVDSNIICFKKIKTAKLLKMRPSKLFYDNILTSLNKLQKLNVIIAYEVTKNDQIEIHLSETFIKNIKESPWFIGIDDIITSKISVFVLKWFLGLQSNRKQYKIHYKKFSENIDLKTSTPSAVKKYTENAIKEISWASFHFDDPYLIFKMKNKGATPIYSLREILYYNLND